MQKNRQNPSIILKVTIDNVGVAFLRHSVLMFTKLFTKPLMGKLNVRRFLILQFHPIHENFMHAKINMVYSIC